MDKAVTWLKTKAKKATHWLKTQAKKPNLADWGMVVFTFIIAATTIAYAGYARRQWKVIADQLYVMGETGRYDQMTQRAFVDYPQQVTIRATVEGGKVTSWTPEIRIVNDGNTGTYNTHHVLFTSEKEIPTDFDYPDTGKRLTSDLGPHETEVLDAQPIGKDAIQSIRNGGHVYVYGLVVYRDVFQFYTAGGPAFEKRHLREFCYEVRLDSRTGDATSANYALPVSVNLYGTHNCTDGDCDDEDKIIARYQ